MPASTTQIEIRPTFERFGNYLLLDLLTSGGMAEVHLARPALATANGRLVVIKRIFGEAVRPEIPELFREEIRLCLGFAHPNIAQFYDFGEIDGRSYIAMEYIHGKNLREVLKQSHSRVRPLPIAASISIAAQVASALQYVHLFRNPATDEELNVVHRDLSPQNIMLSYDGHAKLIDFGIAKATGGGPHTASGIIMGKVAYLSPEQARGEPLDARSDLFSLGTILWELLTGHRLFHREGESALSTVRRIEHLKGPIQPPSQLNAEVPEALDEIVLRVLSPRREDRPPSAEGIQRELLELLSVSSPGFGNAEIAAILRPIFREKCLEEQAKIHGLNRQAQRQLEEAHGTAAKTVIIQPAGGKAPEKVLVLEEPTVEIKLAKTGVIPHFKRSAPAPLPAHPLTRAAPANPAPARRPTHEIGGQSAYLLGTITAGLGAALLAIGIRAFFWLLGPGIG